MRVQDHLAKLSWTAADKLLYIGYGFVNLLQINAIQPAEYACYALLNGLYLVIAMTADSSVLQGIILFGADKAQRGAIHRLALLWQCVIMMGASSLLYALREPCALMLNEPRFTDIAGYLPLLCAIAVPRMFGLKFLFRDVQSATIFWIDAIWFGSMTFMTVGMITLNQLRSFHDVALIAVVGMTLSSLVTVWSVRREFIFHIEKPLERGAMLRFSLYQGATSLSANLIRQLDIVLVQYFFGAATVGVYQAAKTLFRAFEEGFASLIGLLYPGAVRLVSAGRTEDLQAFISKMLSFTLLAMLCALAVIYAGGAEFLITMFLASKYHEAIGFFSLLTLAALLMPFSMLFAVLIAFGESRRLLLYTACSGFAGLVALVGIGIQKYSALVPLGFCVYHAVLGALCFAFVRHRVGFPIVLLWRALPDGWNFLKERLRS